MLTVPTSSKTTTPPLNQARLILSQLRGGDFTHAGDKEAIDMVVTKLKQEHPEVLKGNCLDVGCGFGGTADYLVKQGFKHVWGIDIDKSTIAYAKSKYTRPPQMNSISEINLKNRDTHTSSPPGFPNC